MKETMFSKVKNKLILLYTAITGVILTVVVIMAFFISLWMGQRNDQQLFEEYFNSCFSVVGQRSVVGNLWIKEEENKHAVIQIWDNGRRLKFPGERKAGEEEALLEKCIWQAKEDGISPAMTLVSELENISKTYEWKGNSGITYYGKIGIVKVSGKCRSLVYLKRGSIGWQEKGRLFLILFLLDIAGIGVIYLFNWLFIGQVLKPVEESRKQQAEFIAAVSHELRSPLAVMKANLYAAEKMPGRQQEFYQIMKSECQRMNGLVEDLLLLASKDAGKWQMEGEWIDTEGLLIEAYECYYPVFKGNGIRLSLQFPKEELPELFGDRRRLFQIFSILLSNALRFSKEGSQVILGGKIDEKKKQICLYVEDHGKGVPEEEREKIFERFYQEDKSRGEKEHFGLGLSIARELTILHKGELFCEETVGGGATFILLLPFLERN